MKPIGTDSTICSGSGSKMKASMSGRGGAAESPAGGNALLGLRGQRDALRRLPAGGSAADGPGEVRGRRAGPQYTGIAPAVAVHIPWDAGDDWDELANYAASLGVRIGAVNPNVFQDFEYRFGSLANETPLCAGRPSRICWNASRSCGRHSPLLSLWFADGTNFPGQGDLRARKRLLSGGSCRGLRRDGRRTDDAC